MKKRINLCFLLFIPFLFFAKKSAAKYSDPVCEDGLIAEKAMRPLEGLGISDQRYSYVMTTAGEKIEIPQDSVRLAAIALVLKHPLYIDSSEPITVYLMDK